MRVISDLVALVTAGAATLLIAGCPITVDVPVEVSLDFVAVPAEFSLPDCYAEVPLNLISGLAITEAHINGAGPFSVVVDTGSATTLVSPEVAALFPEATFDTDSVISAAENSTVQVTQVLAIESLTLGSAEALGFHANVVDLSDTEAAFRTSVDAIIGFSAFANVTLTVDYPRELIRIEEARLSVADGADNVVPLKVDCDRPFIDMTVGAGTLLTSVDTGFSGILSVPSNAALTLSAGPRPWFASTDLSGARIERTIARLADDVWLGSDRWETPVVVIDDKTAANLGSGVLQMYALTFDQRSSLLRLARSSSEDLHSTTRYTRGFDVTEIDGRTVVDEILPGGPAEYAGMLVDDVIIEVNGQTVAGLDTLTLPTRDQIAFIDVLRGETPIELAIPTWTWIE